MVANEYKLSKKGKIVLYILIFLILIAILLTINSILNNEGNQKPSSFPVSGGNSLSNTQKSDPDELDIKEPDTNELNTNELLSNDNNNNTINQYTLSIYFLPNESTLTIESISALNLFIDIYKENSESNIFIEGNCATKAKKTLSEQERQLNFDFALSRAEEVSKYLIENNILKENITLKSNGSDQSIESNATEAGRMINRRVDITLERKHQ